LNKYIRENPRPHSISNKITGPLIQKTNELFIRSRGHHSDRWALASQYDRSYAVVLEMLDAVSDDDFEKTLEIPAMDPLLPGQLTIEDLFHYASNHFATYSKQINLGN
ncbi:MAG TPA: hypothetical protein VLD65_08980, partial [Anaerolineales bacterium]|nr:hypothetical protein [Anaerolineales bacterium]